ncbi:MAG TPA: limonene-1,2-epoxide hydrolase family protein [Solirubrobacteraceae bacterium]|jgi:limonene-1,2-epoxide hydrolase|nr:limonene-1,2-epoxide hydrolase family protein [Solirubrobacteraceae bacterium]
MTATASQPAAATTPQPERVVQDFLLALAANDLDGALALVADDIEYTNVSLPTIKGRARIDRVFRPLQRIGGRFRVHFHTIASEGTTVLTERTDELALGRVAQRFWVYGRFEVSDGLITVWRDSFDWYDITISLVRGVAGALAPSLNRRWPGSE